DLLIICTYAPMTDTEIDTYKQKIVFVDEHNRLAGIKK
ncbi:MAG: aspartate 1-decarboxylase, partial [Burkholderiaceae bacterium]